MTTSVPAVHEAGHAWAYWRHDLPLRYITLRPRDPETLGICRPWKPRQIPASAMAYISSAGPLAQAIWARRRDRAPGRDWSDYLADAVRDGGEHDLATAMRMLDTPAVAKAIWTDVERDWPAVLLLADQLDARRTVPGRDAFLILAAASQVSRSGFAPLPSSPS